MTPGTVADMIRRRGKTVTVSRANPALTVSVKAMIAGFRPEHLVGDLTQAHREVRIAALDLAAAGFVLPFKTGTGADTVAIDGKSSTVLAADVRSVGESPALVVLTVKG